MNVKQTTMTEWKEFLNKANSDLKAYGKKKYVWATDKYTSALHSFGGQKFIDKFVVECDNQKQVDAVVSWMEKEGIYSYINWAPYKPKFSGRKYYVSMLPYSECGAIHRYTGVFPTI